MTDQQHIIVKRRGVFFVGGFDPKSPGEFFMRMSRENRRFEDCWGTKVTAAQPQTVAEDITCSRYTTTDPQASPQWTVETDFHFLSLDDVVLTEFRKPLLTRLGRYARTFANFMVSGTGFAFIRHAWRFFLYFFYPALMFILALLISYLVAMLIAGSGIQLAFPLALLVFFATLVALIRFGGNRYHVLHLMDLWSFSRDFIVQSHPLIRRKLDRFADNIIAADQSGNYDEILMIGHSTGGALILDAAARAGEKDGGFGARKADVVVLTVGSTALKVGLHPSAGWFRLKISSLFSKHPVGWVEYQCMSDVINFYQTNPPELMGFDSTMQRPFLRQRMKIKDMLEPVTYKRLRKNFFRIHYQFVFGNNYKYHYDFPAICFGPATVTERASNAMPFMISLISHGQGDQDQNRTEAP